MPVQHKRYTQSHDNKSLAERLAEFPKFPKGEPITWFGDDVGKVADFNYQTGRIVSTNGRSYNPKELKISEKD